MWRVRVVAVLVVALPAGCASHAPAPTRALQALQALRIPAPSPAHTQVAAQSSVPRRLPVLRRHAHVALFLARPLSMRAVIPLSERELRSMLGTPPPLVIATLPPVPLLAPDSLPQILDVFLPAESVTGGEHVIGSVIASSNVASVEVNVAGYERNMEKIAPGRFALGVTVPRLPFFLRNRSYTLTIVARNARGDAVVQRVPILVR